METQAQQYPIPTNAADVSGPAAGTAMTREYVQVVGRMAYVWGWPLVNMANRAAAFSKAPEPGLLGGVVPVAFNGNAMLTGYVAADEHFVTCPNQDVVYGTGYFALDKEPIVFQVPEFGDRFWVYALYDARTDEFSQIGKPYGTKPDYIPHHEPFQYYPSTANPHHRPPSSIQMIGRTDEANHQYDLWADRAIAAAPTLEVTGR